MSSHVATVVKDGFQTATPSGAETEVRPEEHSLSTLNRFLKLVGTQNDYGMVLSLATFIEDTLGRVLLAYFRDCKATKELVSGFNAPLGTLSSRIKAGYAFGLLTKEQFEDMEILRNIRNKFAHNWQGIDLGNPDIMSLIGKLSLYTFDPRIVPGNAREKLLTTLSMCCIELQIMAVRLEEKKIDKAPDVSFRLTTKPPSEIPKRRTL
jgi:DNA-binding MltR family transcriptional regulator